MDAYVCSYDFDKIVEENKKIHIPLLSKPNNVLYLLRQYIEETTQRVHIEPDISYYITLETDNKQTIWTPATIYYNGIKIPYETFQQFEEIKKNPEKFSDYTMLTNKFPVESQFLATFNKNNCELIANDEYFYELIKNVDKVTVCYMIFDEVMVNTQLNLLLREPGYEEVTQKLVIERFWPFLEHEKQTQKYGSFMYSELETLEELEWMSMEETQLKCTYRVQKLAFNYNWMERVNTFLLFNSLSLKDYITELYFYYIEKGSTKLALKQKDVSEVFPDSHLGFDDTLVLVAENIPVTFQDAEHPHPVSCELELNEAGLIRLVITCNLESIEYPRQKIFDIQNKVWSILLPILKIINKHTSKIQTTHRELKLTTEFSLEEKQNKEKINPVKLQKFTQRLKKSSVFEENTQKQLAIIIEYRGDLIEYADKYMGMIGTLISQESSDEVQHDDVNMMVSKQLYKNDRILFEPLETFYSRLCQGDRKPKIATEAEKDDPLVFEYWNFTQETKQYYRCNNKYPVLSFNTKKHPRNYCIPCCSKDVQNKLKHEKMRVKCINATIKNDEEEGSYILKNPNKFKKNRYTLLEPSKVTKVHKYPTNSFIYCLTEPGHSQSIEQVNSVLRSVMYCISSKLAFKDEKSFAHMLRKRFFAEHNLKTARFMENIYYHKILNYNIEELLDYLSYFLVDLNIQLVVIDGHTEEANIYDRSKNSYIILYKYKTIYNPVVFNEKEPIYAKEQLSFLEETEIKTLSPTVYHEIKDLIITGQLLDEVGRATYIHCTLNKDQIFLPIMPQTKIPDIPVINGTIKHTDINNKSSVIYQLINQILKKAKPSMIIYFGDLRDEVLHSSRTQGEEEAHMQEKPKVEGIIFEKLFFYIHTDDINIRDQYETCDERVFGVDLLQNIISMSRRSQDEEESEDEELKELALITLYEQNIFKLILNTFINELEEGRQFFSEFMDENTFIDEVRKYTKKEKKLQEFEIIVPCQSDSESIFCSGNKVKILNKFKFIVDFFRNNPDFIKEVGALKQKQDLIITFDKRNFIQDAAENFEIINIMTAE